MQHPGVTTYNLLPTSPLTLLNGSWQWRLQIMITWPLNKNTSKFQLLQCISSLVNKVQALDNQRAFMTGCSIPQSTFSGFPQEKSMGKPEGRSPVTQVSLPTSLSHAHTATLLPSVPSSLCTHPLPSFSNLPVFMHRHLPTRGLLPYLYGFTHRYVATSTFFPYASLHLHTGTCPTPSFPASLSSLSQHWAYPPTLLVWDSLPPPPLMAHMSFGYNDKWDYPECHC